MCENIMEWLDREQEIKLMIEKREAKKNWKRKLRRIQNEVDKQDLEFWKKLKEGKIKNPHPKMVEKCKNII